MKLAWIGGGSYTWGPTLLTDLALSPHLSGEVVLHDSDPLAGERMAHLGNMLFGRAGSALATRVTSSLAEALDGADVVVLTIAVGGLEAMGGDLALAENYGILQPVGDTVGPSGICRALRSIPVIEDLSRRIHAHCPNAWLINLSNPLTTLCRTAALAGVRVIGLCHEAPNVQRAMAALLGADETVADWQVAGINHLPWIANLALVTAARIAETAEQALARRPLSLDPFVDQYRVKLDLLAAYGTFPAAGDRHLAEFFPHYLRRPDEALARYGVRLTTIAHRRALRASAEAAVNRMLDGSESPNLHASGEQVVPVIEALSGQGSGTFVVNVPNQGQIAGLPDGVVVECMAEVDGTGPRPLPAPPLPSTALHWVHTHVTAQELVVAAALERRPELAVRALLIDPLSWRLNRAEAASLVKAMTAHNARFAGSS